MRTPGRIVFSLGFAALVLALVMTAIGWVLVDAATDTLEDTLVLTDATLDSVEETITVAGGGIDGTLAGLAALRSLAGELDQTLAVALAPCWTRPTWSSVRPYQRASKPFAVRYRPS